jgi:hypothetical protein
MSMMPCEQAAEQVAGQEVGGGQVREVCGRAGTQSQISQNDEAMRKIKIKIKININIREGCDVT